MITTAANEVLSWLHHRVPVFLETEKEVDVRRVVMIFKKRTFHSRRKTEIIL